MPVPGLGYLRPQQCWASHGSNLTVDATKNLKVTDTYTIFQSWNVGQVLTITGGTGFTTGNYTVVSVSGGAAVLSSSPAAVGTTGGIWHFTTPHSTSVCSVSSTGLVTATAGVTWGGCFVTSSVTGLPQRWIAGLVGTQGPIPHFGSDGQVHTTCTSVSDCLWLSTTFETGSSFNSGLPGFLDQEIQPRLSLLGNPINQIGFNTLEPSARKCADAEQPSVVYFRHELDAHDLQQLRQSIWTLLSSEP